MSNQNLATLNVKVLNYTAPHLYHLGQPVTTIPIDPSNNPCMSGPLGINICYGDAITDGSGAATPAGTGLYDLQEPMHGCWVI